METVIEEFRSQGYAVLRGVLEKSRVEAVRRECGFLVDQLAERMAADGKIDDLCANEPFETRLVRLYENRRDEAPRNFRPQLHRAGFFELFAHSHLLDLAEQVVGPEVLLHPTYTARPKLPQHEPTEVPWHQDSGNTAFMLGDDPAAAEVEALRMANMWTPLVAATRHNGCMAFIPGSHRQGVAPHQDGDATTSYTHIADEYTRAVEERAVPIELDPGDVVVFHDLLFHRGLPNHSSSIRWSVEFRYQDATQSTLRPEKGHLIRSRAHPERAVQDAAHWARLKFQ